MLKGEKHAFDGRDDLLAREKAYLGEQVAKLDRSMERLSQSVETLVEEKGVLEGRIKECRVQLEMENVKMESVEMDLS